MFMVVGSCFFRLRLRLRTRRPASLHNHPQGGGPVCVRTRTSRPVCVRRTGRRAGLCRLSYKTTPSPVAAYSSWLILLSCQKNSTQSESHMWLCSSKFKVPSLKLSQAVINDRGGNPRNNILKIYVKNSPLSCRPVAA